MSISVEESYSFWDADKQKKCHVRLSRRGVCLFALCVNLPTMPLCSQTEQPAVLERLPEPRDYNFNTLLLRMALEAIIAVVKRWADSEEGVWIHPCLIAEDGRYRSLLVELGFRPMEDGRFCLPLESPSSCQ